MILALQWANGHHQRFSRVTVWLSCRYRSKLSIQDAQEIARRNGGTCESTNYEGIHKPLLWRCGHGHRWSAPLSGLRHGGTWCPECGQERRAKAHRLGLDDAVELAKVRGGKCLSHDCSGSRDSLLWECKHGHQWRATLASLRYSRTWCPKCVKQSSALSLHVARETALSRGGKCLSEEYQNTTLPLHWQCACGHQWKASLSSVKTQKTWCPKCAKARRNSSRTSANIDAAHAAAEALGGRCLSQQCTSARERLEWQCSAGHVWMATYNAVKNQQTWCPYCACLRRTLAPVDLQQLADSRRGRCLSQSFKGSRTPLLWQCAQGHIWKASVHAILHGGRWCFKCATAATTVDTLIEIAKQLASERGGLCISDSCIGARVPLMWRCRDGHEWSASLGKVRHGLWCPWCDGRRLSMEDAKSLAEEHGGMCLSKTFVSSSIPLWWRCAQGHEWKAALGDMRNKRSWCPCCKWKRQEATRQIFEDIFQDQFPPARPRFLRGDSGYLLQLDGFCPRLKLAFEYNGKQHYCAAHYWHSHQKASFEALQERDQQKATLCRSAGIRLVVVPWFVKDLRGFIQLSLLRWFTQQEVMPQLLQEWQWSLHVHVRALNSWWIIHLDWWHHSRGLCSVKSRRHVGWTWAVEMSGMSLAWGHTIETEIWESSERLTDIQANKKASARW